MTPGMRALLAAWLAAAAPGVAAAGTDFAEMLDAKWDYAKPALSATRFRAELLRWPADSGDAAEVRTQIALACGDRSAASAWAAEALAAPKDDPSFPAGESARRAGLAEIASSDTPKETRR